MNRGETLLIILNVYCFRRFDALFGIYALHYVISGIKMNGFQNGRSHTPDKPSPGCLGRMVNLFDLNSGVAGNRLLTDKPHCDGETLCYLFFFLFPVFIGTNAVSVEY